MQNILLRSSNICSSAPTPAVLYFKSIPANSITTRTAAAIQIYRRYSFSVRASQAKAPAATKRIYTTAGTAHAAHTVAGSRSTGRSTEEANSGEKQGKSLSQHFFRTVEDKKGMLFLWSSPIPTLTISAIYRCPILARTTAGFSAPVSYPPGSYIPLFQKSILNIDLIVQALCPEIVISDKVFHCIPKCRQYDKSRYNDACRRACQRRHQIRPPDHLGNTYHSSGNDKQENNH